MKIESGDLPVHRLRGVITKVYMGSMGDWPMFAMQTTSGEEFRWTRYVNVSEQSELFVEGHRVEVDYVVQRFKPTSWDGDKETKIITDIRVDDGTPQREPPSVY